MANRPAIPAGSDDITTDWLRQALACAVGGQGPELQEIKLEPVGSGRGLLSEVVRCRLSWSTASPTAPSSVIIKLHSAGRKTFRLARLLKLYRREYDFYRRIRPQAGIAAPALLYGDLAPLSHRFVMVLEDLAGLESTHQVDGASPGQAKRAVRTVAGMHGRFWNNSKHAVLSGVPDYLERYRGLTQLGYLISLQPALDRFGDLFSPEARRLAEAYASRIAAHLAQISSGPKTFTHGDYRLDNLFFRGGGVDDVIAIDWQNCGIHSGLRDITYFLSTSVTTDMRRAIERDVVAEYHDAIVGAGVDGYRFDECWHDYRQVMLSCLIGPVFTCGSLDLTDDASRRTMEIGLARTLAAVEDLDSQEFLPGRPRAFSVGNVTSRLSAGAVRACRGIGGLLHG